MENMTKEEFEKKYNEDSAFREEVDKYISEDLGDGDLENVSGGGSGGSGEPLPGEGEPNSPLLQTSPPDLSVALNIGIPGVGLQAFLSVNDKKLKRLPDGSTVIVDIK